MLKIQELDGFNYDNVSDWLLKQTQEQTSGTICPRTPLADQGLSSLELSNLAAKTSQKYSVEITTADIFSNPTIQDFSKLVLNRRTNSYMPPKQPQNNQSEGRIAIIGMSCSFPGCGSSLENYWDLMNSGNHGLSIIPNNRWNKGLFYSPDSEKGKSYVNEGGFIDDIEAFDAELFGISPREAMVMDPQHRLLLQAAWRALEHAGMTPRSLAKSNTGVFIGIFNSDYASRVKHYRQDLDMHSATGMFGSMAAHRISYHLDLTGPSIAVDTASSASLSAIHMAVKSLTAGECDMALAGGVNVILSPEMHIICSQAGLMARDARCKTFDDSADGYIRSEGLGIVALKPLDKAIKDGDPIQAIIAGTAANQDGRSNGITAPNGEAQQSLLKQALDNAGLKQEQIQYIETHGTGTPLGDPIEVEAISEVYQREQRQQPIILGSVKPCIGHAESAAGVAGLIKTVLCMQHEEIPAQYGFEKLNHRLEKFKSTFSLPRTNTRWPETGNQPKRAGVSSFSIGGANAHVLLEEPPKTEGTVFFRNNNGEYILPIGADTPERLRDKTLAYADFLEQQGPQFFENTAYTSGRAANHEQVGTVFSDHDYVGLIKQLREFSESENSGLIKSKPSKTAFLFTGQGSQHPGMGLKLYNSFPFFKEQIDRCSDIASSELDVNLKNLLFESSQAKLNQTNYTQPALFAYEYSLARLWMNWGIEPSIMMGHSVGEYVAACLAGVFSLEDGLRLVIKRGQAIQKLPVSGSSAGGMYAVLAPQEQIHNILNEYKDLVDIAAINGPENIVISGNLEQLKPVISKLESQKIKTVQLSVSHAFHSKLLEPALAEFHNTAQKVSYSPPSIPVISNVTGKIASGYMLQSADYWCAHMRKGVQFQEGVKSLENFGVDCFAEAGPKPILTAMAKRIIPGFSGSWVAAKQLSDVKKTATETQLYPASFRQDMPLNGIRSFPKEELFRFLPQSLIKQNFFYLRRILQTKHSMGKQVLRDC